MNKRIIATSVALLLAMAMVLAVGKTGNVEHVQEAVAAVQTPVAEAEPQAVLTNAVDSLPAALDRPLAQHQVLVIPSEFDEAELILEQGSGYALEHATKVSHPLMASLAQVEAALENLEQLVANTERAVVALEQQQLAE